MDLLLHASGAKKCPPTTIQNFVAGLAEMQVLEGRQCTPSPLRSALRPPRSARDVARRRNRGRGSAVVNAPKAIVLEDRGIAMPHSIISSPRARTAVSQCQWAAKAVFAAMRVRGHTVAHFDDRQHNVGVLTSVFDDFPPHRCVWRVVLSMCDMI